MRIQPVASDSMGSRSMATFVETEDVKILIDPSVALGPRRYGLPPHPLELEKLERDREKIKGFAKLAGVLILTHYHYDHHSPEDVELFRDKLVLTKDPEKKINKSQRGRARFFLERIGGVPKNIEYSDGKNFVFKKTKISFSKPVFHGTDSRLGFVTELSIREGKGCFVFTSDVEGPSNTEQTNFIIDENPVILYLDGPLSYMLGFRYSYKHLEAALENMKKIIMETEVEKFIVDHHLLRDIKWRERIKDIYKLSQQRGVEVLNAAEFNGEETSMLEAKRRELYKEFPP